MNIKTISGICFSLAMFVAILLLLEVNISIPQKYLAYAVIGLGVVGIVLNLLTAQQSKHNIAYSVVYWTASLLAVVGIGMVTMNWPYAEFVIYAGVILMGVSFFIPKKRKTDEKNESDLLDDI
jgi:chromate transport protein ChrA